MWRGVKGRDEGYLEILSNVITKRESFLFYLNTIISFYTAKTLWLLNIKNKEIYSIYFSVFFRPVSTPTSKPNVLIIIL